MSYTLEVTCLFCGATIGERCRNGIGKTIKSHASRRRLANRLMSGAIPKLLAASDIIRQVNWEMFPEELQQDAAIWMKLLTKETV